MERYTVSYNIWKEAADQHLHWDIYEYPNGSTGKRIYLGAADVVYESFVSGDDVEDFDTLYGSRSEVVDQKDDAFVLLQMSTTFLRPHTSDGKPVISQWPTEGSRKNLLSVNWADKTTWWYDAARVVGEDAVCIDEGTWTQYELEHDHVIDTYHGKIFGEDFLTDHEDNTYRVQVLVDGEAKEENDPDTGTGDFEIDYENGIIHFNDPLYSEATVTVTYHYAQSSVWKLIPEEGKILECKGVEVQFSEDMSITTTAEFSFVGDAQFYAPEAVQAGQLDPDDKVPLTQPVRYKNMMNYCDEANGMFPVIPKTKNPDPTWRDMTQGILTFPWDYQALIPLRSSRGMEIHVRLLGDIPYKGEYATATFYCLSRDE